MSYCAPTQCDMLNKSPAPARRQHGVRPAVLSFLTGSQAVETRHAAQFLRIHRNALVARRALRTLEKHHDTEEGDGWAVRLDGIDEPLAVSRRQLPAVRAALRDQPGPSV